MSRSTRKRIRGLSIRSGQHALCTSCAVSGRVKEAKVSVGTFHDVDEDQETADHHVKTGRRRSAMTSESHGVPRPTITWSSRDQR